MSSFTTPLIVEDLGETDLRGRSLFRVKASFVFEVGAEGSGIPIEVPENYVTNYASVPRPFRWLVPVNGKHGKACVLHDYLCNEKNGAMLGRLVDASGFSRFMADAIFYEAMCVSRVPWWQRQLIYRGVRIYAQVRWVVRRFKK